MCVRNLHKSYRWEGTCFLLFEVSTEVFGKAKEEKALRAA